MTDDGRPSKIVANVGLRVSNPAIDNRSIHNPRLVPCAGRPVRDERRHHLPGTAVLDRLADGAQVLNRPAVPHGVPNRAAVLPTLLYLLLAPKPRIFRPVIL
jgi:hypothetical protein